MRVYLLFFILFYFRLIFLFFNFFNFLSIYRSISFSDLDAHELYVSIYEEEDTCDEEDTCEEEDTCLSLVPRCTSILFIYLSIYLSLF